jgi:tetratricopeptide (TPR) repeat protein
VLASALGDSVVVPVLILLVLAAGSVAAWKRFPLLPFAVFGSAVVLSPTSTFVPLADFYVEHRMYLPIALLAMALVPATGVALERIALRSDRRAAGIAGVAIAASIAVVLGFATTRRNALLSDPVAMMEDALEQAPQNERVQYNLANAYKRDGRTADAIARYEAAIRIAPNIVRSYENLGSLYSQAGRYDDALRVYLAGVKAKPDVAMAHRNVALAYLRLARPEEALASAKKSLELDPRSANGLALLGQALESLGRRSEAAQAYRDALAANPGDRGLSERLAQLESH